jgi:amino acid adenylation domain-containing protein
MKATANRRDLTITRLFADQVRRQPQATAVQLGGTRLSYAGLDFRAEQLARHLRTLGIGPETVVGVCMERSIETVVALVGIVKAGGAYLPLEPNDPPERVRYMVEQAAAPVVLTQAPLLDRLPPVRARMVCVDDYRWSGGREPDPVHPPTTPESLAYVCYTSGSTGEPKGVCVPHRGVVRLVREGGFADFGPGQTWLHLAPLAFDASTLEIWGPLLTGGRLVVYPPGPLSLAELTATLRRDGVTALWLTAGLFHRMVDRQLDALGGLHQLLAGGDVLSPAHVNRLRRTHPRLRMINGYGPTENTTFTCCHTIAGPVEDRVPIGRPINGTRVYVLDEELHPVTDGTWGELYAAGAGLARGYLGRADLTAERFLPDPFEAGARMYRTGDVVRRAADGTIEFKGRRDAQVKIRGYRVELGEIEAVLAAQPGIKEAVVVARDDVGDTRTLVGYVVPESDEDGLVPQLRRALNQALPRYMMPGAIVTTDRLPLTRNGKVDRSALPAPQRTRRDVETAYVQPGTALEEFLADLVADVLGLDEVGAHDDFFELGGNSLLVADLMAQVQSALSAEVHTRQFFEHPTVAALAALVGTGGARGAVRMSEEVTVAP